MLRTARDQVIIGIPTYRRPALLRVLLDSLAPELAGTGARVVVADNDAGHEAPAVVADWSARTGIPAVCVPVVARGISEARNALVRTALADPRPWRWLVMLDDDGRVTPGWWDALLGTVETLDVEAVGGAVRGELPAGVGRVGRCSLFGSTPPRPTGVVDGLIGAQNLCLSRRLLEDLTDPWFDPALGATGGEDSDLFRRITARGGRFGWCEEAVVVEATPAERLTPAAVYRRVISNGVTGARIDCRYYGRRGTLARAGDKLVESGLRMVKGAVLGRPDKVVRASIEFSHNAGRVAGLLGVDARALYGATAARTLPPAAAGQAVPTRTADRTPVPA